MNRRTWAALSLLAALLIFSFCADSYLCSLSRGLTQESRLAASAALKEGGENEAAAIKRTLDETEGRLYSFARHEDADAIQTQYYAFKSAVETGDTDGAYAAANELARLCADLGRMTRVTASNIF